MCLHLLNIENLNTPKLTDSSHNESLFNSTNLQISDAIKIREYQRRITLRKLHQVPSNQNVTEN